MAGEIKLKVAEAIQDDANEIFTKNLVKSVQVRHSLREVLRTEVSYG